MGFEVTVVIVIFFISALVVGTFSYTALSASSDIVADASAEQQQIQNERLHTSINIDHSVPGTLGSTYDLTVTLTNTGSETLRLDELTVLIDGRMENYSFSEAAALWVPAETRSLTIPGLTGAGTHRIKVVTENGVAAYDTYLV
jgi:flagellar protein FlaF